MDDKIKDHVLYYMQKLEKETRDDKMLRYLRKLHQVPITTDLLMETGVGKLVNKLKKIDGEVGKSAQALVLEWKEAVSKQRSEGKKSVKKGNNENPYLSFSKTSAANNPSDYNPSNSHQDYSNFKQHAKSNDYEKSPKCDKNSPVTDKNKESKKLKTKSKSELSNKESSADKKEKSSKRKHDIKEKKKKKDNLDSQIGTFEDCLSFNDTVPFKRRKPHGSSASSSSHQKNGSINRQVNDKLNGASNSNITSPQSLVNEIQDDILDISSTLPQIQPDYKPTPRYEILPAAKSTSFSQSVIDETMFKSSKGGHTKLYSGRANRYAPKLITLQDRCIQVLKENVGDIETMGFVPYMIIKSVLEICTAQQLFAIEYYNPYLVEDTDELWTILSGKDFRNRTPDEMESWREMYLRLSDEREQRLKKITTNISKSIENAKPVRKAIMAYVGVVAKPPREVARAQARKGTGLPVGHSMEPGPPGKKTPRPRAPAINTASSSNYSHAAQKKKVAPLMLKTLNSVKSMRRRR